MKLVEQRKPRYNTNNPSHLNVKRARVASSRVPMLYCKVLKNVSYENGAREFTFCNKEYSTNDELRRHLCGTISGRAHNIKDIRRAYPKIKDLSVWKPDPTRYLGITRRSITNAQKRRHVKSRRKRNNSNEQVSGRKGKKVRRDYEVRWVNDETKILDLRSKTSDRGNDSRYRSRLSGAGQKLKGPISDHEEILLKVMNEIRSFENVGYGDVALEFEIELEMLDGGVE